MNALPSIKNYPIALFSEVAISTNPLHKKILLIAAIALGCLALSYTLYRCFRSKIEPSQAVSSHPVAPRFISIDEPIRSNPPVGYEWVLGEAHTQAFMESDAAKDLGLVAALAKSATVIHSPLQGRDTHLNISDLIKYATKDQTDAIVGAIADSRSLLRATFYELFFQLDQPNNDNDDWNEKAQAIINAVSVQQLMNLLVIPTNEKPFQVLRRSINARLFEEFLKRQKDLNLPKEFIDGCMEVLKYAEYVDEEAEKEIAKRGRIMFC